MSGIVAIYHRDGRTVATGQLHPLMAAMAWRGSDQQGAWVEGAVGLGAVQLWTTAEAWGTTQPTASSTGCRIVLDGRLDNRPQLAERLDIPLGALSEWSDAAILLRAYEQWGEACVDQLVGAFAFVIWDPARQALFGGRDPVGLRTLFYHWDGTNFYAASTLRQFRALSFIPTTLNDDYVWDFLTTNFTGSFDLEATPFQALRRLPGGHRFALGRDGLRVERYWRPWALPPVRYKREAEYAEHFRSLFETVVEALGRSNGPLGVALSGGFDSSALVCIARELERAGKLRAQTLHTFTILFDESLRHVAGELVNTALLEAIQGRYDGPAHVLECADWIPMFDEIPYRGLVPQDEPFIIPSRPWRNLGLKVRQAQPEIRVLLTGLGADEGLATSLFFVADWLRQGRIRDAQQTMKALASVPQYSYPQVLVNLVLGGIAPRALAYRIRQLQHSSYDLGLNQRFHIRLPPWLPNRHRLEQRCLARLRLIPQTFSTVADQAPFERNTLLLGDNVRLWEDQYMGLAAGLELRHPFYDRRLLDFMLCIPTHQKLGRTGTGKHVLRRAMSGLVPLVPWQTAGGNGLGFIHTYRESLSQQWPAIEKMFQESRAAEAGFIDPSAYLAALAAKRSGPGAVSDVEAMSVLALEFWLREIETPVQVEAPVHANGWVAV